MLEQENVETSGLSDEASSQVKTGNANDTVAYGTFSKSVEQEKRARQRAMDAEKRANELEDRLKSIELQEDERKGNFQNVIEKLKDENSHLRQSNDEKDKVYGWSNLESAIKQEAMKQGCVNAAKLVKLLDKSDLSLVKLDGKYQANAEDIAMLVDRAKGENDFLFKARTVEIADGIPNGKMPNIEKQDISRMSMSELKQHIIRQKS